MAHGITAGAGPALPICRSVAVRRRRVASLAVAGRLMQRGVAVRRRRRCIACPGTEGRRLNRRTCRGIRSGRRSALRIRRVPATMHGAISQGLCEIVPKRLSPAVHQTAQPARDPEQQTPAASDMTTPHRVPRIPASPPASPPADWPRSSKPHPHEHRGHGRRGDAGHERQPDRRQAQLASVVAGRLMRFIADLSAGFLPIRLRYALTQWVGGRGARENPTNVLTGTSRGFARPFCGNGVGRERRPGPDR